MANRGYRILVIDDLEDWRRTLRRIVETAGYEVVLATSKADALEQLGQQQIDLALIDLSLTADESNQDGLGIAHEIRRSWPHTKSVIITAYGTSGVVEAALQSGQNGQKLIEAYLGKDETDKLVPTIDGLLDRARKS